MRNNFIVGITLLCLAVGLPLPVAAQNLSNSGGTLLHLSTMGTSTNSADSVTIFVPIRTEAATAIAARQANVKSIEELKRSLVEHGISSDALTLLPGQAQIGFIGNEVIDQEVPQMSQALVARMSLKSASSTLQIKFSDPALLARVRDALDERNQAMGGPPLLALNDDRAAKSAAIADALANARRDADAYALPLGLKVVRIQKISNVGEANIEMPDTDSFIRMMSGVRSSPQNKVVTRAQVWIDFELAAR